MNIFKTHLEFLRNATWNEDVFPAWAGNESQNPGWHDCAMNIKGWNNHDDPVKNWGDWRLFSVEPLAPETREWKCYKVNDPLIVFPELYVGPFQGWQNHCKNKLQTNFAQLVADNKELITQNTGINAITAPLREAYYWGVYFPHNGHIYLMDGSHRSGKITLWAYHEPTSPAITGNQILFLTELSENEFTILETMLERGSSNPNQDTSHSK